MNKIEITDDEIAKILANGILRKKIVAADAIINKYLKEITNKKDRLNFIGDNYADEFLIDSPKEYAKWCVILASEFIADYSVKTISYIEHSVNRQDSGVEFNFEIYQNKHKNDSSYVTILVNRNGIITDINGQYMSIVKERDGKNFTGYWNANISHNLKERLPLMKESKRSRSVVLKQLTR